MIIHNYLASAYTTIINLYVKSDAYGVTRWNNEMIHLNYLLQEYIFPKMLEDGGKETEHGIWYDGFEYRLVGSSSCDEAYCKEVLNAINRNENILMDQDVPNNVAQMAFLMMEDYAHYGYEPSIGQAKTEKRSQYELIHVLRMRANETKAYETIQSENFLSGFLKKSDAIIELWTPLLLKYAKIEVDKEEIVQTDTEIQDYIYNDVRDFVKDTCPDLAESYNDEDIKVTFPSKYLDIEADLSWAKQVYLPIDKGTRLYLPAVSIEDEPPITLHSLEKELGELTIEVEYPTQYEERYPVGSHTETVQKLEIHTEEIKFLARQLDIDLSGLLPNYGIKKISLSDQGDGGNHTSPMSVPAVAEEAPEETYDYA